MTTAHRPTFDPARGKDAQRGPAYHQSLLPAHKTLKYRQALQGTEDETNKRDLRAELLRAEKAHLAKKEGREPSPEPSSPPAQIAAAPLRSPSPSLKRPLADTDPEEESYAAKKARVLAETAAEDASSDEEEDDDEEDSDDDSEDGEAALFAELAKIKRERAEAAAKEAAAQEAKDEDAREREIALGNPLLRPEGLGGAEYGV